MNLNDLSKAIHENAVAHGWYDEPRTFGDVIALCHSELSEALEEHRNKKPMLYAEDFHQIEGRYRVEPSYPGFEKLKPEGIAVEMADCLIRILDWAGANGVDMDAIVQRKHEYNKSRPYRHGNKAL